MSHLRLKKEELWGISRQLENGLHIFCREIIALAMDRQIVNADEGILLIDEYPGGNYQTWVANVNASIFDKLEDAQTCFHKDDEKREKARFELSKSH